MRLLAAGLAAAVAGAVAVGVLALPDPAPTLAAAVAEALPLVGLGNPVTAVLMTTRAIDTLVEKVVIVVALVGVWSLAADRDWGGRPEPRFGGTPDGALVLLARTLPPVGIVVGIYMVWAGADRPGGAFPGGTVLAAMWLLAMMAGLAAAPSIAARRVRLVLVAGPAVFLAVGLAGIAIAGAFLAYPVAIAKPLIVLVEVPLTLSIAATLGLLLAGAPERERSR
jgi:multisubunit Na+/H+ antiporter MnhB subunit